jgi:hypothetical protein
MGVMIAVIALFGNLLYVAFCALLLHVFNSFLYITSVRGFFESEEIHKLRDDIVLLSDDRIKASEEKTALMTLPRLILSKEPLKENKLVKHFYVLSFFCGLLALLSAVLISYTVGNVGFLEIFVIGLIIIGAVGVILYFFNRIIEIAFILLSIYILLAFLLSIIDLIILPFFLGEIDLILMVIPIDMIISGLLVIPILIFWYLLTKYYFWRQIRKKNRNKTK